MTAQDEKPDGRGETAKKLPYEAPAVAWQDALEVRPGLLAICQKLPGGGGDCDAVESFS